MKTPEQLWQLVSEFDALEALETPTRENIARQLSITEHFKERLGQQRGPVASMDDYHLVQTLALYVMMAPSRAAARHGPLPVRVFPNPYDDLPDDWPARAETARLRQIEDEDIPF